MSSMETTDDYVPPVKLKKTTNDDDHNDLYCFECHDEGDVICCDSCPRVYHSKCLGLTKLPDGDWTCPECTTGLRQSNSKRTSSVLDLSTLLKFALKRMQSHPQAAPFMQPVDPEQMPEYLDYIIHPMDLETIEKNINANRYTSTDAFIADVKWITHNSVVFNGSQSKFTAIARSLLKIARHEMSEIEICAECYLRSVELKTADWFAEPCTVPHTLCWAKMKGYQPWPAKVLRIVNDEVDVRFFGQHDRAWVSINNCFLLSKEYPGVEKKKSNANFEKSLSELQIHIERLKSLYGQFTYAPLHTPLSKTKPFKFVSIIDDSGVPNYVFNTSTHSTTATATNGTLRSSVKCAKQARSPNPQPMNETLNTMKPTTIKRSNENGHEQDTNEPVKRARVSSKPVEESTNNSNRIVLRIRKTSEDLSTGRSETLSGSSSSHQLTVLIKEPLVPLKEDEEIENESQTLTSNVFELFDETKEQMEITTDENTHPQLELIVDVIIDPDVQLTIDALLDEVDAVKNNSEPSKINSLVSTSTIEPSAISEPLLGQPQFAERRISTKQPRKSRLQHRIVMPQARPIATIPPKVMSPTLPEPSLSHDRPISPMPTSIPLRPLSTSPCSTELTNFIAEPPSTIPIEPERPTSNEPTTMTIKSEPIDTVERRPIVPLSAPLPPSLSLPLPTPEPACSSSSSISSSPSASNGAPKSFLISPPANPPHHKSKPSIPSVPLPIGNSNPTFAPKLSSSIPPKNIRPPNVPINVSIRPNLPTAQKRSAPIPQPPPLPLPLPFPTTAVRNSNGTNPPTMRMNSTTTPAFDGFQINPPMPPRRPSNGIPLNANTPPLSTRNPIRMPVLTTPPPAPLRPSIEDLQTPGEIQMIIKNFNDKFQQLLADFTVKIESALEVNRLKYEKELEETRRSYRMSMNELRTITTQQVQEMHNSLELQYWTRIAEMRNRYESTLQHQMTKSSKTINGGPR